MDFHFHSKSLIFMDIHGNSLALYVNHLQINLMHEHLHLCYLAESIQSDTEIGHQSDSHIFAVYRASLPHYSLYRKSILPFNFKDTCYTCTWHLIWHQSLWLRFTDTSNSNNLICNISPPFKLHRWAQKPLFEVIFRSGISGILKWV